jgi:hypothetical protein
MRFATLTGYVSGATAWHCRSSPRWGALAVSYGDVDDPVARVIAAQEFARATWAGVALSRAVMALSAHHCGAYVCPTGPTYRASSRH